jgi:MarR family transcriptional regulator, temperature-dependent positive regulator of motility
VRCAPSGSGYHRDRSTREQTTLAIDDIDLELLRQLESEPAASQRNLAQRLGVSVGKVNYCLRALVDRGWVKSNNFRRSDNKLAYAYYLTPKGMAGRLRLTATFLRSKEQEFELLQRQIAVLRVELHGKPLAAIDPSDTEIR